MIDVYSQCYCCDPLRGLVPSSRAMCAPIRRQRLRKRFTCACASPSPGTATCRVVALTLLRGSWLPVVVQNTGAILACQIEFLWLCGVSLCVLLLFLTLALA